ncbi:MAG: diguanylate cyclase [Sphingobium sp.]
MEMVDLSLQETLPAIGQNIMVFLVDDQVMVGEAVRRTLLNEPDIEFHYCSDCVNALEIAKRVRPSVILQDLVMPGVHGLDLVREYRGDPQTRNIPIIVLSTKEEATVKREAFHVGANDYLVKLPEPIELVARIRYHSNAYLTQLQRDAAYSALRRSQQELTEINLELQRLTNVDGLTALSNRRYLQESLDSEWKHALRTQTPISAMMIDIDHFKLFNDTYGHLAGDETLRKVAEVVKAMCRRTSDIAARYGGEEFIAIMPSTGKAEVETLASKIVDQVAALNILHAQSPTHDRVTISVGTATMVPRRNDMPSHIIKAADEALYAAKRAGRNRAAHGQG